MAKRGIVALLILVMLLSAVGMGAIAEEKTFLIGTYLQLTGSNSVVGNAGKQGIDLAVKLINENGGFNGAKVEVVHYDTTGSTEEAVKVVQKMLVNDAVDAVIGSVNSNEVSAVIPYLNEAEIYNFGLGTSATWMADTSRIWTFRASANNGRIAPQDADLVLKLGYKTVAVMNGTDDTGSSTADAFIKACEEKGITVTTRQQCDSEDTDFSGQIAQIMATDPDVIFVMYIAHLRPLCEALRHGYTGMIACKELRAGLPAGGRCPELQLHLLRSLPMCPTRTSRTATSPSCVSS